MKRPDGHCGRAEQRDRLVGERLGVADEVEAPDVLEAGRLERAAVAVRVAPALVLVALDGVRLDACADVGQRLLRVSCRPSPRTSSTRAGRRSGSP